MKKFDRAQDVLKELIRAYYVDRDAERVLDCLAEDVFWTGTEAQETACGKENVAKLLNQVFGSLPAELLANFQLCGEQQLSENVTMLHLSGTYPKRSGIHYDYQVRGTVCCAKHMGSWLVSSLHVSVPNDGKTRRQLENQLSDTQKKEIILQNSIPGGTAIYRIKKDGRVETDYISDNLAKLTGYTDYDELLTVIRDNARNGIPENEWYSLLEAVKQSIAEGKPIMASYHLLAKNGERVAVTMNGNVISKGTEEDDVAVIYAVHTLVSEQELQAQRYYRTIMDLLGISYWEWTKHNGFFASESFKKYTLSERPIEQMRKNQILDDAIYPEDVDKLRQFFSKGDKLERQASVILRMKLRSGEYQWTEIIGFKEYDEQGDTTRLSCAMRDVGQEWIDQRQQLEKAIKAATQANASKTEFLSRISHDMRTPLNGIIGMTQLAFDNDNPKDTVRCLEKINTSSEFLLGLINDVLDMEHIESGMLTLHPVPYSGEEFQQYIDSVIAPLCRVKNIKFVYLVNAEHPFTVLQDKLRVNQIYFNLLSNAAKCTPEGGEIRMESTAKELADGRMQIIAKITDNGIGMSEDFQKRMFEPFSQEMKENNSYKEGSGLGLAIVKRICDLMKIEISVESRLGQGTTFTLTGIYEQAVPDTQAEQVQTQKDPLSEDILRQKTVLVCEDHPLNQEIIRRLLEKKGMVVVLADDGKRGVEAFARSAPGEYAAVLMDVRMPVMDGLQAAAAIRNLPGSYPKTVPIIALTANAYEEDVRNCLRAGMNSHLSKPIRPERLYETLAAYMREPR